MASEDDDKDSLFEGMVLFNPSQISMDQNDPQQPPPPQPNQQPPSPQSVVAPATNDSASSWTSFVSQPLDENLFSDLTLMTTVEQTAAEVHAPSLSSAPESPSKYNNSAARDAVVSSSIPRQTSVRKKKRAGLRIGYGRDAPVPDDSNSSIRPLLSEDLQTTPRLSADDSRSSVSTLQEARNEHTNHEIVRSEAIVDNDFANQISETVDYSHSIASTSQADKLVPDGDADMDAQPVAPGEDADAKEEVNAKSPIELRFEQIRALISQKLERAIELVSSVTAARKDSIRRRRKVAEDLTLASTKHRELEKQLEEACEAEDFETAERVSTSLASAENEKELFAVALRDAEADCDVVDTKMQEALECQIAVEEECASLLELFTTDASNNAGLVLKNAEATTSKEMERWFSSSEALEVKKMELEIESHFIQEAQSILNKSIEDLVIDDRRERELVCNRKKILTGELEELLALVKKKEAEIAEANTNIEKMEKKIADVASGFEEVQLRIDAKYDDLQLGISQVELENEALSKKEEEIDELHSQEESKGAKIRELARISADEAAIYKETVGLRRSLMQFILKSREHKVKLAKTEEELLEDIQMLRQEVSAARVFLQEQSSMKSSIQQEVESCKQRLLFIDKRAPELEAEKRVAATARNFKEAARIAIEAKTLSVEKEAVQVKMEESMLELEKIEKEIFTIVERLRDTEVQISTKEKDWATTRFERLVLVAGAATSARSAALELGDLQEADILLAEAEAADSEAKKLQPICNFKDEDFTNLPQNFISMELVSSLGGKQLTELVASAHISTL